MFTNNSLNYLKSVLIKHYQEVFQEMMFVLFMKPERDTYNISAQHGGRNQRARDFSWWAASIGMNVWIPFSLIISTGITHGPDIWQQVRRSPLQLWLPPLSRLFTQWQYGCFCFSGIQNQSVSGYSRASEKALQVSRFIHWPIQNDLYLFKVEELRLRACNVPLS